MRWRIAIMLGTLVASGCGGWRFPGTPPPAPEPPQTSAAILARADELSHRHPEEARRLYRQVLRDDQSEAAASEALFGLARLRLDPDSSLKDYHLAAITLARLRARYPNSRRAADARAWQAALTDIERCERESSRLQGDLDRLKQSDIELEGEP